MKIIDAHSHIDYLTHTVQSDVVGTVCCTTNCEQWDKLINIMNNDSAVYGAFGVHPWFVNAVDDNFDMQLEKLLNKNSLYMVGEIGLDKHKPDMDKQIDVFIKQFDIAIKLKRIVCLHCVGAWDKILYILKQYNPNDLPIIIAHAFNENDDITMKLVRYKNIYFSFNKNCVYGRNNCIEQIPINRILVETDGKSNVNLIDVVNQIANIKNESDMADIIYNNTKRIL